MKKIISSLAIFVLFLGAKFAYAQVVINEVELNPTGARFIELYNGGGSAVDLTGWYLQRKTQNQTDFGSLVSKTNFKGHTISADGYFLISRSATANADIILGDLTLTESNALQLKNSKGIVVDKVNWGDANIPNPPDGKSIQRISSGWIVALPTPRSENAVSANIPVASVPIVSPIVPVPETQTKIIETPKVKTKKITDSKMPIASENNIQKNNLTASPILSDPSNQENSNDSYLFFGALAFFLILATGAVYFIRQKKVISKAGDDFKILDE